MWCLMENNKSYISYNKILVHTRMFTNHVQSKRVSPLQEDEDEHLCTNALQLRSSSELKVSPSTVRCVFEPHSSSSARSFEENSRIIELTKAILRSEVSVSSFAFKVHRMSCSQNEERKESTVQHYSAEHVNVVPVAISWNWNVKTAACAKTSAISTFSRVGVRQWKTRCLSALKGVQKNTAW